MWQHTQFKSLNILVSWNEHARLSLFKRDIIRQWIKQWYTEELSGCHCCLLRLSWEVWNRWRWITTLLNIPKSDRRQAPLHSTWRLTAAPKPDQTLLWLFQICLSHSVVSPVSHYSCWGYETHWVGGIWLTCHLHADVGAFQRGVSRQCQACDSMCVD